MSELKSSRSILEAMTRAEAESSDPDYQAWVRREIEAAVASNKAHPERRIPQRDMWKKHGLES